jgi:site-specific DNA-methyltransferase (adenine-specific)
MGLWTTIGSASNADETLLLGSMSGPTSHHLVLGDCRRMAEIEDCSIHLVVTSPPYGNLKTYPTHQHQLGNMASYEAFLEELDRVWAECFRVLVPGGRMCCVVGNICVSRRKGGRHHVLPLSSDIVVRGRRLGFDNLQGITWVKVANIKLEASRSTRYLGKPNLPNGVIKNDTEHILMMRKPGGYRSPTPEMEQRSRILTEDYARWFAPIWDDVPGASTRNHPAPFPLEIPRRLIRMFSFAGDTVLDPFTGTGTTQVAAIETGRASWGYEVEPAYLPLIEGRLAAAKIQAHIEVLRPHTEPASLDTPASSS